MKQLAPPAKSARSASLSCFFLFLASKRKLKSKGGVKNGAARIVNEDNRNEREMEQLYTEQVYLVVYHIQIL